MQILVLFLLLTTELWATCLMHEDGTYECHVNRLPEEKPKCEAFSEDEYLLLNQDVKAGVRQGSIKSGFDHYMRFGQFQGRECKLKPMCTDFIEAEYLALNPDVKRFINEGYYRSGLDHYIKVGHQAGLKACKNPK